MFANLVVAVVVTNLVRLQPERPAPESRGLLLFMPNVYSVLGLRL